MGKHPTRRGYFLAALAGGVVAALLLSVIPAVAASGDRLVLGAQNRSGRSTWLTSRGTSVLKLNNTGGNPALDLRVERGVPPLQVNSTKRVVDLNADRIDGLDARDLIRVGYDSTDEVDDANGAAATVTISAPRRGLLVMSGTIDAAGNSHDLYICRLMVDGYLVIGTEMQSVVHAAGGTTINNSENCSTTGVQPVAAGSHQVTFDIVGWDAAVLHDASLWAMYVPFDHNGNPPNSN
jgi:hypothetical protein